MCSDHIRLVLAGTILAIKIHQHVKRSDFTNITEGVGSLHDQILKHSVTLKQFTLLTHEEFHEKIVQLNELSEKFIDSNGKQLLFKIQEGTDTSLFWKRKVCINCIKLDSKTMELEKSRELSLKEFLQVYNTLELQLVSDAENSADVGSSQPDIRRGIETAAAGLPFTEIGIGVQTKSSSEDYCCICLDGKPQVSLPCTHGYCLACIEQWNLDNKTCPICREPLENRNDVWVLEDLPNPNDISSETQKSLTLLSK